MKAINILLIEDNPLHVSLIRKMLKDISYNFISVVTLKEGYEQIQKNNFDIILLDLNLPDSTGLQTFQKVINFNKEIPIVLITGIEDEQLALKLIKKGAQDYINKQSLNATLLRKSVFYSIERQALLRNIKRIEQELRRSSEQLLQYNIEKAKENVRAAIARELHDNLGQALTAIKIDLGIIRQNVSDSKVVIMINKVSAFIIETIKEVQRLTLQLKPQIIDDLGFEEGIEFYTKEFAQRNKIEVFSDIDSGLAISPDASLIIFRIMQEALTNIVRHSGATRVDIELSKNRDNIDFRISDNGIGIADNEIKSKKSLGIIGMKERAALLGGTIDIYCGKNCGTVINLIFPLKHKLSNENSNL